MPKLTMNEIYRDIRQMRFERLYQTLITENQRLEDRVDGLMRRGLRGHAGPVGGPCEEAFSLQGWMYIINKELDRRTALLKQLEFLEENCDLNWAKLWDRLGKELPK